MHAQIQMDLYPNRFFPSCTGRPQSWFPRSPGTYLYSATFERLFSQNIDFPCFHFIWKRGMIATKIDRRRHLDSRRRPTPSPSQLPLQLVRQDGSFQRKAREYPPFVPEILPKERPGAHLHLSAGVQVGRLCRYQDQLRRDEGHAP